MFNSLHTFCQQLSLCLLLACLTGCNHSQEPVPVPPRPVKALRIGDQNPILSSNYSAEIQAPYESIVSFRIAGKLMARLVAVSDRVRKGQVLAKLDTGDYRLSVTGIKAQLDAALVEHDFAKANAGRFNTLFQQKLISPAELERQMHLYQLAKERADSLQAQLQQAKNQLAYGVLTADQDSIVTAVMAENGQTVATAQPVLKLAPSDAKDVVFSVPEQQIAEFKLQQDIQVVLDNAPKAMIKASIHEIASAADPLTRTYVIKASLPAQGENTKIGMTATVYYQRKSAIAELSIPLSAVFSPQTEPDKTYVWLIDETKQTVHAQVIKLGALLANENFVVTGLSTDQLIVESGAQSLQENQKVKLLEQDSHL